MGIEIAVAGAIQIKSDVWETHLAPSEVRTIGPCSSAVGAVTVLLLSNPIFDQETQTIRFPPQSAAVLNVGNTSRTIIVSGDNGSGLNAPSVTRTGLRDFSAQVGTGDGQYLRSLDELPDDLKRAGELILQQVREHFPGDLRAVGARRFQETPDNFWFVTIQPRVESLSITVRGLPSRFHVENLNVIEDRRPYSRFKVRGTVDVPEAVQIILNAVRKRA